MTIQNNFSKYDSTIQKYVFLDELRMSYKDLSMKELGSIINISFKILGMYLISTSKKYITSQI